VIDDCNGDGSDEVLVSDGRQVIITSAYGGRLLYWFDLATGQQFVGNQLPVIDGEYTGSGYYVPPPAPARWLPESDSPQDIAELADEAPPTRMGRYFPDWIWDGEAVPLRVAARSMETDRREQPLIAQTRAFADHVTLDAGEPEEPPLDWLDSRLEKNGVTAGPAWMGALPHEGGGSHMAATIAMLSSSHAAGAQAGHNAAGASAGAAGGGSSGAG